MRAGTRLESLLSTVHEPTEHVPQGLQEQDWSLCCPCFMNLQNMSWRQNLKDGRDKTGLFVVHVSWTYRICPGVRTSRSAGSRPDSLLSTVHEKLQYMSWCKKREKTSTWDLSFVTVCKCAKCQTQTLEYVIVTILYVIQRYLVPGFK